MLELAILGLLKDQDLHGYELKKQLSERIGLTSGVSFGSLYPALGRLERSGAVRSIAAAATVAVPQTGSLGGEVAAFRARASAARSGRSRKVYGITPRGEEMFEELLAEEPASGDDRRVFNLRLAFARYLPSDARLGMLERRRAKLIERLGAARSSRRSERLGSRLDEYVSSLLDHDREATEHDLSWIDRLIARELTGGERSVTAPAGDDHQRGDVPRGDDLPRDVPRGDDLPRDGRPGDGLPRRLAAAGDCSLPSLTGIRAGMDTGGVGSEPRAGDTSGPAGPDDTKRSIR